MIYGYGDLVYVGGPPFESFGTKFPVLGDQTYQRFFSIHNGFFLEGEIGIFSCRYLAKAQYLLRKELLREKKISSEDNCSSLGIFPFYARESMADCRCFIIDSKIRQYFSSYNLCVDSHSLFSMGKFTFPSTLPENAYYTFLLWLEQYLLYQKP